MTDEGVLNASIDSGDYNQLESGSADADVHRNKLGTLNGVFIPCSLNIMGVILFLYLGWGVGQLGVLGVLGVIVVAETIALTTVSSFSAIVTNGNMQGGGSYFMISRSLGPEFGGSMGLLFYIAYATGVALYIIGFSQSLRTTFFPSDDATYIYFAELLIGSCALLLCFGVSYVGADAFSKFNTWMYLIQVSAIIFGIVCYTFRGPGELKTMHYSPCLQFCDATAFAAGLCHDGTKAVQEGLCYNGTLVPTLVGGFSLDTLRGNLWPRLSDVQTAYSPAVNGECTGSCTVAQVFGVLFPMATGIMEGANLSGDLANPAAAIPRGTFAAVGQALVVYLLLTVSFGGSFPRETLVTNLNLMQEAAPTPYPVIIGILISTLSSALGSLFGGSRVLQAVARDNLLPGLGCFAKGSVKGDEPRRAVVVTWLIAQCLLTLGSITAIAPLASSFFLLSYALTNLTAFVLRVTGAPNFRPRWRFYAWPVSLFGSLACLVVMVLLDPLISLVSVALMAVIFAFIWWRHPVTDWGDVSQALMYHQVRKYLLKLDEQKTHTKFWRPSVMVLVDGFHQSQLRELVHFCHELKKGGLMVLGSVLVGSLADFSESKVHDRIRANWLKYIQATGLKAFPQEVISPTLRVGYQFLLQGSGIGGIRCNTVALPLLKLDGGSNSVSENNYFQTEPDTIPGLRNGSFYEKVAHAMEDSSARSRGGSTNSYHRSSCLPGNLPVESTAEYVGVLHDMRLLRKNVIVTANFEAKRGASAELASPCGFVDVWLDDTWKGGYASTGALMLQLASILLQRKRWKGSTLRLLQLSARQLTPAQVHTRTSRLCDYLTKCRIHCSQVRVLCLPSPVVPTPALEVEVDPKLFNAAMRDHSTNTVLAFVALPPLPDSEQPLSVTSPAPESMAFAFLQHLQTLAEDMPPMAMVAGFEGVDCMTADL